MHKEESEGNEIIVGALSSLRVYQSYQLCPASGNGHISVVFRAHKPCIAFFSGEGRGGKTPCQPGGPAQHARNERSCHGEVRSCAAGNGGGLLRGQVSLRTFDRNSVVLYVILRLHTRCVFSPSKRLEMSD